MRRQRGTQTEREKKIQEWKIKHGQKIRKTRNNKQALRREIREKETDQTNSQLRF